jgi:hypothetical protein
MHSALIFSSLSFDGKGSQSFPHLRWQGLLARHNTKHNKREWSRNICSQKKSHSHLSLNKLFSREYESGYVRSIYWISFACWCLNLHNSVNDSSSDGMMPVSKLAWKFKNAFRGWHKVRSVTVWIYTQRGSKPTTYSVWSTDQPPTGSIQ